MLILGSDELSVLTNEVVSGVESITKALSKLGEYHLLLVSTLHRLPRLPSLNMWLKVQMSAIIVQRIDSTIHWKNQKVSMALIHWIVICLQDSIVQPSNN